jgi:hypothetical protein
MEHQPYRATPYLEDQGISVIVPFPWRIAFSTAYDISLPLFIFGVVFL